MAMIRAILSDTRGGAALVMALAMPIFAGGLGFGAEAGLWYFNQRKLQNAADIAAYAPTRLRCYVHALHSLRFAANLCLHLTLCPVLERVSLSWLHPVRAGPKRDFARLLSPCRRSLHLYIRSWKITIHPFLPL